MYDIIVIGGGPAGLTAATYALRAGKTVLVIEKNAFGGQITWSPKVENFPGTLSVSGAELGDRLLEQAMEQGADVELEEVCGVSEASSGKTVRCVSGAKYKCRAVVIATGAKPRMLGLPNESALIGNGVCFCAVCDGAFYRDQPVAVNGGGNSALQDAMLLSEKCSKVYLIHRRESFRGEAKLVEALREKPNVEFLMNSEIRELLGDGELTGLILDQGGSRVTLSVSGLFVAIGHAPDNESFRELLELDAGGYAASGESCLTKTPGIFVAGDCRRKSVHQLTTAMADGSVAALAACTYLDA